MVSRHARRATRSAVVAALVLLSLGLAPPAAAQLNPIPDHPLVEPAGSADRCEASFNLMSSAIPPGQSAIPPPVSWFTSYDEPDPAMVALFRDCGWLLNQPTALVDWQGLAPGLRPTGPAASQTLRTEPRRPDLDPPPATVPDRRQRRF